MSGSIRLKQSARPTAEAHRLQRLKESICASSPGGYDDSFTTSIKNLTDCLFNSSSTHCRRRNNGCGIWLEWAELQQPDVLPHPHNSRVVPPEQSVAVAVQATTDECVRGVRSGFGSTASIGRVHSRQIC